MGGGQGGGTLLLSPLVLVFTCGMFPRLYCSSGDEARACLCLAWESEPLSRNPMTHLEPPAEPSLFLLPFRGAVGRILNTPLFRFPPSPSSVCSWFRSCRAYFKCARASSGCPAKKFVDFSSPDPAAAAPDIRYSSTHNHPPPAPVEADEHSPGLGCDRRWVTSAPVDAGYCRTPWEEGKAAPSQEIPPLRQQCNSHINSNSGSIDQHNCSRNLTLSHHQRSTHDRMGLSVSNLWTSQLATGPAAMQNGPKQNVALANAAFQNMGSGPHSGLPQGGIPHSTTFQQHQPPAALATMGSVLGPMPMEGGSSVSGQMQIQRLAPAGVEIGMGVNLPRALSLLEQVEMLQWKIRSTAAPAPSSAPAPAPAPRPPPPDMTPGMVPIPLPASSGAPRPTPETVPREVSHKPAKRLRVSSQPTTAHTDATNGPHRRTPSPSAQVTTGHLSGGALVPAGKGQSQPGPALPLPQCVTQGKDSDSLSRLLDAVDCGPAVEKAFQDALEASLVELVQRQGQGSLPKRGQGLVQCQEQRPAHRSDDGSLSRIFDALEWGSGVEVGADMEIPEAVQTSPFGSSSPADSCLPPPPAGGSANNPSPAWSLPTSREGYSPAQEALGLLSILLQTQDPVSLDLPDAVSSTLGLPSCPRASSQEYGDLRDVVGPEVLHGSIEGVVSKATLKCEERGPEGSNIEGLPQKPCVAKDNTSMRGCGSLQGVGGAAKAAKTTHNLDAALLAALGVHLDEDILPPSVVPTFPCGVLPAMLSEFAS